ncbi:hypothetical protein QG25_003390 [Salmonella enterica subsp. salamae]|nr:hypothetical protein [Salmonella enterica subsp. salamae serovar Sofia]ECF6016427.1 hypothetical protein [Salmonella enterica subsp. salamae serovar Sofia]EDQ9771766.1 hypothetical protein [Salmonella enterica subsp. salamae]
MQIFTTTQNVWIIEGLRHALLQTGTLTGIRISVTQSVGELLADVDGRMPEGTVLLLPFPDNHPATSLRSLIFLSEWQLLQSGLFHFRVPCILWGRSPLVHSLPAATRIQVVPWYTPPSELGVQIMAGIQRWQRHSSMRRTTTRVGLRLSPREMVVLRYTLDGRSLDWIAQTLGVSNKTAWTHRRRAMDVLGIRRLHELMQVPASVIGHATDV